MAQHLHLFHCLLRHHHTLVASDWARSPLPRHSNWQRDHARRSHLLPTTCHHLHNARRAEEKQYTTRSRSMALVLCQPSATPAGRKGTATPRTSATPNASRETITTKSSTSGTHLHLALPLHVVALRSAHPRRSAHPSRTTLALAAGTTRTANTMTTTPVFREGTARNVMPPIEADSGFKIYTNPSCRSFFCFLT
jgi:hypothetical protein